MVHNVGVGLNDRVAGGAVGLWMGGLRRRGVTGQWEEVLRSGAPLVLRVRTRRPIRTAGGWKHTEVRSVGRTSWPHLNGAVHDAQPEPHVEHVPSVLRPAVPPAAAATQPAGAAAAAPP